MFLDIEYSLFNGLFGDKRLDRRLSLLLQAMVSHESAVINRCCESKTSKTGAYRMINNSKLELSSLLERLYKNSVEHLSSTHVLCIQDTTEINYTDILGRLDENDSDVGPINRDSHTGFFCHPTLVVDTQGEVPLGFSHIHLWNRRRDKVGRHARNYQKQKITDKESYRWIESSLASARLFSPGVSKTIVGDRESDIYEALSLIPQAGCHFLLRSSSNRKLADEPGCLLEKMQSLPCLHTYELTVKGNHSRKSRKALLELRYAEVKLAKPHTVNTPCPDAVKVNCIYVVEKPETVPVNESPIEWRLLTSHPVETVEQAMQCVGWYKLRWYIEEVFRLLKSKGMDVESAQLESGKALKKMVVLSLVAALQIMSLKLGYDKANEYTSAKTMFTDLQIDLLRILLGMVEGKTAKQKNPFKEESIAWAAWIVARMGGWDGYASQGPPGYITMRNGIERFETNFRLFKNLKKDV